jgi:GGDEF domain-containing protein
MMKLSWAPSSGPFRLAAEQIESIDERRLIEIDAELKRLNMASAIRATRCWRTLQMRRSIENTSVDGIRVTSSFGVAVGSDRVEQVLAEADARLYAAKQSGRSCGSGPVQTVGPVAAA